MFDAHSAWRDLPPILYTGVFGLGKGRYDNWEPVSPTNASLFDSLYSALESDSKSRVCSLLEKYLFLLKSARDGTLSFVVSKTLPLNSQCRYQHEVIFNDTSCTAHLALPTLEVVRRTQADYCAFSDLTDSTLYEGGRPISAYAQVPVTRVVGEWAKQHAWFVTPEMHVKDSNVSLYANSGREAVLSLAGFKKTFVREILPVKCALVLEIQAILQSSLPKPREARSSAPVVSENIEGLVGKEF